MYIKQYLIDDITRQLTAAVRKIIILYGPRQVGKTTLIKQLLLEAEKQYPCLLVNGDDVYIQEILSSRSIEKLKAFIGKNKLLIIDEAQNIQGIGLNLKIIFDHLPEVQVIATGSSSFDLQNEIGEPLIGRKKIYHLYPLSQIEFSTIENGVETKAKLEERLLYGAYPEVVHLVDLHDKKAYLSDLASSYLMKDVLRIDGLRKSKKIIQILQMLAFQIGKDVSVSEIGQQVGLSKSTVEKYLDLLEQSFILYNITAFSRNLRSEIVSKSRYYFYDVGVRNAIINQFNPIAFRNDVGVLWENYLVMERLKKQEYLKIQAHNYFWRTYTQQEVDWIEEINGQLFAYEFKWKPQAGHAPSEWQKAYPNAHFSVIHNAFYLDFIT